MRVESGLHPLSFEQLITIDSHEDYQRLLEYLKAWVGLSLSLPPVICVLVGR